MSLYLPQNRNCEDQNVLLITVSSEKKREGSFSEWKHESSTHVNEKPLSEIRTSESIFKAATWAPVPCQELRHWRWEGDGHGTWDGMEA